ncbi:TonB-dependent receptor [Pedobacter sp. PACM 27299]|uniref:TonB-dependent receptor n=1 Tax=Pedobacter sp. PACM 27299 TaxID=1727164 RepID=UPI000705D372|nr:TonB-dependent receptor [Pedobacter sp. PACM 27299]ALL06009.1 TonB-dependent receptor [Pedobacter sp. PACM 27299]
MNKSYRLSFCLLICSAPVFGQSNPAVQDTTLQPKKSSPKQLKEVVIKDRRPQLRKEEEALNIEIVNSSFIQRNLGGSLMKSLERLPGIQTIGIGSGQSKPLIRGLGFNRVLVVDQGLKHEGQQWGADHGLEIDQFAIGEVELIKGAASFRYGSDAIAGVIDLKPQLIPAKNSFGGSVNLLGKSNNDLYGSSVNLYGRQENWFFDARITYQNYGDYRVPVDTIFVYDYAVKLHNRQLRNTAGRETALHYTTGYIGKRFKSLVYLSNVYSKSGFFANAHGLEPRNVDEKIHDASSRDIQMPSQEVNHFKLISRTEYQVNAHQLALDLGYQRNFRQEFSQYVNHGFMPPVYPDTMSVSPNLEREFDKHVYSFNLRDKILLGKHEITAGLSGEYQQNTINGWTFLVPSFKQVSAGLFAYDKYRVNENLLLHAALRYDFSHIRMFKYTDWFESERGTNMTAVGNESTAAFEKLVRSEDLNRSFNSLVWSAGLNYNLEQFSLKANVGKSFRMPIAKELGANGVNYHYFSFEKGDPSLNAEQSYQADLSLGWTADRWSVLLSPFYNYFPNYIYLNPTSGHDDYYGAGNQIFQYAQSKVMRYGGELQLKLKLLESLSTSFSGEYLYARQLSGDKKGYTLPFSPPASALFNLSWSPVINEKFQKTYFSIDYRLTSSQNNIVPPEKKTPGYGLIDLQIGTELNFQKQALLISLQAQNLMNTRYLNHTSFYRLIGLPESGRNLILSIKVPFQIPLKKS